MQLGKEWNNFIRQKFNGVLTEMISNHRHILISGNTTFLFPARNKQIRLNIILLSLFSMTCLIN
jgi:hypothetical protein